MNPRKTPFFLALLTVFFIAVGCGRPSIEIDTKELQASSLGLLPVGLVEVHRANSGNGFGMSIGESMGESAFCTGTLLSDGTVMTSSDCLENQWGKFEAKDMEFHINPLGTKTESFKVEEISQVDTARHVVYLLLKSPTEKTVNNALQIQSILPSQADLESNVPALAVSVPGPDKNGVSRIVVSSAKIRTSWAKSEKSKKQYNIPPWERSDSYVPQVAQNEEEPSIEDIFSYPTPIYVEGLRDGIWGAPIFYQGKVIGIVKNSQNNSTHNAQWLLRK